MCRRTCTTQEEGVWHHAPTTTHITVATMTWHSHQPEGGVPPSHPPLSLLLPLHPPLSPARGRSATISPTTLTSATTSPTTLTSQREERHHLTHHSHLCHHAHQLEGGVPPPPHPPLILGGDLGV
ncbi:hypothetical protein Pcinc_041130 [Petrolisthes cinctipes]|uniref:Uncharacterized protein n=1 Tax=Petrolisthes cinctipes TaxID=88211 RepID=A0AAE1BMP6_PETCI|nr:hypothetical protein Pcinc_041130 [Petrolisthes cinctipes]